MNYRRLRITADDRAWHDAFFAHVAEVFPGIDFRRWGALGGWDAGYDVLALAADDRVIASIGRTRMTLVIDGAETSGYQLGAVATRAGQRGQGLARRLMDEVLADADREARPVFLFANPSVLDFYPRFGFRRVAQSRFGADAAIVPNPGDARAFDPNDAGERRRLAEICTRAVPTGRRFGTRSYYSILLWHLCNHPLAAHWLAAEEALLVTESDADRLILHDVVASRRFDLAASLPALATGTVGSVEFGFEPGAWWPGARPLGPDDAPLFVRGLDGLQGPPFRFPDLAQT